MNGSDRRSPRCRGERGANLVEMALVLPLLLMLLMGVVDVGRAFYSYVTLTNAVREGARFASRFPYDGNDGIIEGLVVERVRQEPGLYDIPAEAIEVTTDGLGDPKGSPITVTGSLAFDTFVGGMFAMDPLTITTSATMRIFGLENLP